MKHFSGVSQQQTCDLDLSLDQKLGMASLQWAVPTKCEVKSNDDKFQEFPMIDRYFHFSMIVKMRNANYQFAISMIVRIPVV